ncbi:hypothetical protein COLO4_33663 [Corchorus olitorius]|uniref:SCP domain-containing protein n=1 Tax=Corchorus olitorius TaxID=93759 RepID=A0A1R3GSA9_9ROSI|nr:hypothetical protein COLO4_33663 [Corchorus olitorius]
MASSLIIRLALVEYVVAQNTNRPEEFLSVHNEARAQNMPKGATTPASARASLCTARNFPLNAFTQIYVI